MFQVFVSGEICFYENKYVLCTMCLDILYVLCELHGSHTLYEFHFSHVLYVLYVLYEMYVLCVPYVIIVCSSGVSQGA